MNPRLWGMMFLGVIPVVAGSLFTHPDGVFSLKVPEGWEARVMEGEEGSVYVLQHVPDYAATVIMGYVPGAFSPDNMEALHAEVREAFPTLDVLNPFRVYAKEGQLFRAKGDFVEYAGGKETRARIYVVARPMVAAYLICLSAKQDFRAYQKAFSQIAAGLQLARPRADAQVALAGTWESGSAYSDPFSDYSSFLSKAFVLMPDGKYTYSGSVSAGGEGVSAYGGGEERGFFFVIGRSVFLVAEDGTWLKFRWAENNLLVGPEGERYVRTE